MEEEGNSKGSICCLQFSSLQKFKILGVRKIFLLTEFSGCNYSIGANCCLEFQVFHFNTVSERKSLDNSTVAEQ